MPSLPLNYSESHRYQRIQEMLRFTEMATEEHSFEETINEPQRAKHGLNALLAYLSLLRKSRVIVQE